MIPARRNRARRRGLRVALFGAVVTLAAAELVARFGLGLGDPPLFQKDDAIEYILKPGTYHRFGHTIHINRWSQRSPEIDAKKTDPNELRVLVIGDSVVIGGALLDDEQIAAWLLERSLREQLARPVRVLSVAAGSWGPQNQLAYLHKFGTFDADIAVVVWSSHDAWDVPRFDELRADQPQRRPLLASGELVVRYALPRLRRGTPPPAVTTADLDAACGSASALLTFLKERGIPTGVVMHSTRGELLDTPDPRQPLTSGRERLWNVITDAGTTPTDTAAAFRPRIASGEALFQDDIHPNAEGQRVLADVLRQAVQSVLGD